MNIAIVRSVLECYFAEKYRTARNNCVNRAKLEEKTRSVLCAFILLACLALTNPSIAAEGDSEEHETAAAGFRLDTLRTWYFRSFLPDESDDADTLGLEFNSSWSWGKYDWANIAYIELADYPVGIPGQPVGNAEPGLAADTGINDLLSAFLISKQSEHHSRHHFAYGFSIQLPTGSDTTLTSGKYSIGPAVEYEYSGDRLYAAFVVLQLWSVDGDADRADVNMMMIKPIITYDLSQKWKAIYMPYGVSVYWDKPSGQRVYFPLGGGIQRQFNIGSLASAFSVQLFENVARPDKGTEHDFRLLLEVNF